METDLTPNHNVAPPVNNFNERFHSRINTTGGATLRLGVRSVSMSNEFSGEISFLFCAPSRKTSDFD